MLTGLAQVFYAFTTMSNQSHSTVNKMISIIGEIIIAAPVRF